MKEQHRDIFLAILCSAGVFWLVDRWFNALMIVFWSYLSDTLRISLLVLEMIMVIVLGLLVWKKIQLSDDFSKYFIIFFGCAFLVILLENILIAYRLIRLILP